MSIRSRLSAPWSLRRRLVVAILLLLLAVSAVVGTVSVLGLNQSLVNRLDQQVAFSLRAAEQNGPIGGAIGGNGFGRRVGSVIYLADATSGAVQAQYFDETGGGSSLSAAQRKVLAGVSPGARTGEASPVAVRPVTVDLGGSLGRFRVVADRIQFAQTGDAGILVVGQSMSEVDATTRSLVLIFGLIALVTLAAAGIVTAVIVRLALRPLDRVAATATRVAELPLDKGEVALAERVPEKDTDPRTEVGKVGDALNRMLGHVEDALVSR